MKFQASIRVYEIKWRKSWKESRNKHLYITYKNIYEIFALSAYLAHTHTFTSSNNEKKITWKYISEEQRKKKERTKKTCSNTQKMVLAKRNCIIKKNEK